MPTQELKTPRTVHLPVSTQREIREFARDDGISEHVWMRDAITEAVRKRRRPMSWKDADERCEGV